MSDPLNYREIQDEARAKVIEAAQMYIDGQEQTQGGVITGWVLIVESADPDTTHSISWCTGNGMPTGDAQGGLARWRMIGMIEDLRASIQAWLTAWYVRTGDE